MNQAGRGCHPTPPSRGDGALCAPPPAPVLSEFLSCDGPPALMRSADWRALPYLVSSSAPASSTRPEPAVILESESGRLVSSPPVFVLPEVSTAPGVRPPVPPVEGNATWG